MVCLGVLSVCILMASTAIMPSYFLSSVRKNLVSSKLELQKQQAIPVAGQNTLATIANLTNKLVLIENAEKNKYLVSQKIINEIILKKLPGIKINQITYENTTLSGKKVTIRGVAPSRERLLLLRKALEDNVAFKKVELPISNFVKGSDIPFSINLIPS